MKSRGRGSSQLFVLLLTCALPVESHRGDNASDVATKRQTGCNYSSLEEYCAFPDDHTCNDNTGALLDRNRARCCGVVQCPYQTSLPDDDCDQAVSVSVNLTWFARDTKYVDLLIHWTDPPAESSTIDGYQIWIAGSMNMNGSQFMSPHRCTCLPADTRNYRVKVLLLSGWYIHVKLVRLPTPLCGSLNTDNTTTASVPECWDTIGANLDKCGVIRPTAPLNLTVTQGTHNTTHVMLHVTWSPPQHHVSTILHYQVTIVDVGQYQVNGTTLQYSIAVIIANSYDVQVRASSGKVDDGSCRGNFCWSDRAFYQLVMAVISTHPSSISVELTSRFSGGKITATILTETSSLIPTLLLIPASSSMSTHIATTSDIPDSPEHSSHKALIIGMIVFGLIVLLAISATLVFTVWCVCCQRQQKLTYRRLIQKALTCTTNIPTDKYEMPPNRCSGSVFIVHSEHCNEKHLKLIRQLCHGLSKYSIKSVVYEFDKIFGPTEQGITRWTENNFIECDKVLFVCNKELSDDWTDRSDNCTSQVVAAARLAFHGWVNKDSKDLSKFGVVLLEESHHKYIPGLVLNSPVKFVYPEHNGNEEIAQFIRGVPKYVHPNSLH